MKFTTLTREAFSAFTDQHPSHFTQMAVNYDLKISEGIETHLLGVKDENNEIIAAGLFTSVPIMKIFKYFYSNRGPVMDYHNRELVTFFFNELKKYMKQHKALNLRIDPYVPYQLRNHDGDIIETYKTDDIFETLKSLGFKHDGFTTGFHPIHQIRWHSVLDLKGKTKEQLIKDMDSLRKRNTKKVIKNGIKVRYLEKDELHIFRSFMQDTSDKKDFEDRGDEYYISRLEKFGDRVKMPLAYIDFNTYIPELEAELTEIERAIDKAKADIESKPENKKAQNKLADSERQKQALLEKLKEAQQLKEKHGDTLPIAAAFYFINPHEVVYYAGGSSNEFRHFSGSYAIQWHMINYAIDHGIDKYNFYGISGIFNEDAPDAGVIKFKKGYNADVIEYIGDFELPVNKSVYNIYKRIKK